MHIQLKIADDANSIFNNEGGATRDESKRT